MSKQSAVMTLSTLLAGALLGWFAASSGRPGVLAQGAESPEATALRKAAEEFARAFNKGDAKAVAAFWTKDGEYVGPDGEAVRGRDEIEKSYAEFFKQYPKTAIEVEVKSVKLLGTQAALQEGSLKVSLPGEKEPAVSRYSVMHVREGDAWRIASAREWVPTPAELITLKDVEWLIGDWMAKSGDAEARLSYTWDEDKAYLRGRYTLKRDGKVVSSGTQVLGKDPVSGLRSWQFESDGSYGEWAWSRDERGWVIEAVGTLTDGSEVTAVNLLVPIDKDSFTWQSVERTAGGTQLADTPPLKVARVKAEK